MPTGGYTNFDEPALHLRINEGYILRLLGHRNICELDLDEKITVLTCLINQLLTFAPMRDAIEERHDKLHQAKRELKLFLLAEQKKEKEEKEKMKEREKEGKLELEEDPKPKKLTRGNYEEEKKKEEYENKLKELQQAARDDKMMLYLGADRCHRRYWRVLSIPGARPFIFLLPRQMCKKLTEMLAYARLYLRYLLMFSISIVVSFQEYSWKTTSGGLEVVSPRARRINRSCKTKRRNTHI